MASPTTAASGIRTRSARRCVTFSRVNRRRTHEITARPPFDTDGALSVQRMNPNLRYHAPPRQLHSVWEQLRLAPSLSPTPHGASLNWTFDPRPPMSPPLAVCRDRYAVRAVGQ